MENTEVNGEIVVDEESVEASVDNSGTDVSADNETTDTAVDDSTGSDVEQGEASDPGEASTTVTEIVNITEVVESEYTLENPMPVYVVETVADEEELEVFSLTGSYPGTISDTYLNFFKGIVEKLKFNEHYVVYRSGQYSYIMIYGEDIALDGDHFSGAGNYVNIYRDSSSYSSDWYVEYGEDSVNLDTGTLFVYSDLGMYPTLKEGVSSLESMCLLFAVGFAVVYSVCHDIFDYIMEHVFRK